jgi:Arc/MetJ-type ribon-helix-helix transcriptional regulator
MEETPPMTIHLPQELERYIHEQVLRGELASTDEALTEAVRLLQQREPVPPPTGARGTPERTARQLEDFERLCRKLDSMPLESANDDGFSNRDHDRILYGK